MRATRWETLETAQLWAYPVNVEPTVSAVVGRCGERPTGGRGRGALAVRVSIAALVVAIAGCSGGGPTCNPDPLKTGITDQAGTDAYDCLLLQATQKYNEPDAMIFKAIIYVESRFQIDAAACPNLPCGTPAGWSATESECFGLMQIVPACNPSPSDLGLLSNGHPNLTVDQSSMLWATSIFNPAVNIQRGVAGIADNRQQVMAQFPGCTEEQYTLMAIGNYNNYGSTKSCTTYNTSYDSVVLARYQTYCAASGWPPHPY